MKQRTGVGLGVFILLALAFSGTGLGGTVRYEYDAMNRLIRAESQGDWVIEYTYDVMGNRFTRRVASEIPPPDQDGDGDVDGTDLVNFLGSWDGTAPHLAAFARVFGSR